MDALLSLFEAFGTVFQWQYLLYCFIGAAIGTAVGVLPGLGPAVTMSLLLPVVWALGDPTGAIIMFCGIFLGAMYGGSTTSILLSTPGESSSVVSVLDGYRMTKAGRGGAALFTSAFGSFVAGVLATFALTLIAQPLVKFALSFGPAEYFAFAVLALATTSMLGGKPLKAAYSALLGLAVGTVGIDGLTGTNRFTFGVLAIYNGIDFELVTIGLYAVVEVLFVVGTMRFLTRSRTAPIGKLYMTKEEWRRSVPAWLRGTGLGFFAGLLPGAGATVASYLSYGLERNVHKHPEKFGRGRGMIEGLAGPEAANNAASQGALVPLLTLGIPPTAATAVMLGALQGFGVKTGPLLMRDSPEFVWAIVASLLIGNILLLILNIPLIGVWVRLLKVPTSLLAPMILVISTVGVFSLSRNTTDLVMLLIFGVIGLLLRICDYPLAPMVLGLVLGPLMEAQWGRGLTVSGGSWSIFVSTTTANVILILAVIALFMPMILKFFRSMRSSRKVERR